MVSLGDWMGAWGCWWTTLPQAVLDEHERAVERGAEWLIDSPTRWTFVISVLLLRSSATTMPALRFEAPVVTREGVRPCFDALTAGVYHKAVGEPTWAAWGKNGILVETQTADGLAEWLELVSQHGISGAVAYHPDERARMDAEANQRRDAMSFAACDNWLKFHRAMRRSMDRKLREPRRGFLRALAQRHDEVGA